MRGRRASVETREKLRVSHLGKTPSNAGPDPNPSRICQCGCGQTCTRRRRYLQGHHVRKNFAEPYVIEPVSGCWVWQRGKNNHGYGQINRKYAHRVYFEAAHGPIPRGLVLDHLCRNPSCVNPSHLEPVTQRENIKRARYQGATSKSSQV